MRRVSYLSELTQWRRWW